MMYKGILVMLCVFGCAVEVYSKPTYKSGKMSKHVQKGVRQCFKQECPENTYACEKISRVSEDKKQIESEIRCLGLSGKSLKNLTTYQDNPFGPETEFKSYSYSGAFEISVSGENDNSAPTDTEIVNKENSGQGRTTESTSEIEDLNKADAEVF